MINGIPVHLKGADESGAPVLEKACFATARKCPELANKLKAIHRTDLAETAAVRRAEAAKEHLEKCLSNEIDQAEAAAIEAFDRLQDASQAVFDAIRGFCVSGFEAAGYDRATAERYAGLCEPTRLGELKAKCLMGAGMVDFFSTASPV
jgi:hypothetical protein